jgi:cation transport ATPase
MDIDGDFDDFHDHDDGHDHDDHHHGHDCGHHDDHVHHAHNDSGTWSDPADAVNHFYAEKITADEFELLKEALKPHYDLGNFIAPHGGHSHLTRADAFNNEQAELLLKEYAALKAEHHGHGSRMNLRNIAESWEFLDDLFDVPGKFPKRHQTKGTSGVEGTIESAAHSAAQWIGSQYTNFPDNVTRVLQGKPLVAEANGANNHKQTFGLHVHGGQPAEQIIGALGLSILGNTIADKITENNNTPFARIGSSFIKLLGGIPMLTGITGKQLGHAIEGGETQDIVKWGFLSIMSLLGITMPQLTRLNTGANISAAMLAGIGTLQTDALDVQKQAIDNILAALPGQALLIGESGAGATKVDADTLKPGDRVKITSGQMIPADCDIIRINSGDSVEVNDSQDSGQKQSRKVAGHKLYQGALLMEGEIEVRVNKAAKDSYLRKQFERIRYTDDTSQHSLLENVLGKYLYLFVGSTALQTLYHTFKNAFSNGKLDLSGINIVEGLEEGGKFGMIASDCNALVSGAAFPLFQKAMVEQGVLITKPVAVERIPALDIIVSDLTGTLTAGDLSVTEVYFTPASGQKSNSAKILNNIAALEQASSSTHVIADAMRRDFIARNQGMNIEDAAKRVANIQDEKGYGVKGRIDQQDIAIGRRDFIEKQGVIIPPDVLERANNAMAEGKTVSFVIDGSDVGFIAFSDPVRNEAVGAVQKLVAENRLLLVTGQDEKSAMVKARELGIPADKVHAGVLPEQKAEIVRKLKAEGLKVGYVCDGLNDRMAAIEANETGVSFIMHDTGDKALSADAMVVVRGIQDIDPLMKKCREVRNLAWGSLGAGVGWTGLLVGDYLKKEVSGEKTRGLGVSTFLHEFMSLALVALGIAGSKKAAKSFGLETATAAVNSAAISTAAINPDASAHHLAGTLVGTEFRARDHI